MSCVSLIGAEEELGCSEALTAFKPSFNRAYVHNIISPFEIITPDFVIGSSPKQNKLLLYAPIRLSTFFTFPFANIISLIIKVTISLFYLLIFNKYIKFILIKEDEQ